MHYLGLVMSKTKDLYQRLLWQRGYLCGFDSDLTKMLENKLLVLGK